MIQSFKHKALRRYWTSGQTKGLNAEWIKKIRRILLALEASDAPEAMNIPGWYFHALSGNLAGTYSVRLTGNMRITFQWDDGHAVNIDLEDYH